MSDIWIWIPNWERFQHYKDRNPPWIKNYVEILSKEDYLDLSSHRRGVLHGIWVAYALSHCRLRGDARSLSSRLRVRVKTTDVQSLNHAGFIELLASSVLAERLQNASTTRDTRARADARSQEAEAETEKAKSRTVVRPPAPEPGDIDSLPISNNFLELQLIHWLGHAGDEHTPNVVHKLATSLPEACLARVVESTKTARPRNKAAWLVGALKAEREIAK